MDEKVKAKKKAKRTNTVGNSKNIADKCDVGVRRSTVGTEGVKSSAKAGNEIDILNSGVTIKIKDIVSANVDQRSNGLSGSSIYRVHLDICGDSAEHVLNQMQRYYTYIQAEKEKANRVKMTP